MVLNFDDWYDSIGHRLVEESNPVCDDDFLENEYESYVSEYEDLKYEEYKEEKLESSLEEGTTNEE